METPTVELQPTPAYSSAKSVLASDGVSYPIIDSTVTVPIAVAGPLIAAGFTPT